jgi:hypothetical protein
MFLHPHNLTSDTLHAKYSGLQAPCQRSAAAMQMEEQGGVRVGRQRRRPSFGGIVSRGALGASQASLTQFQIELSPIVSWIMGLTHTVSLNCPKSSNRTDRSPVDMAVDNFWLTGLPKN